MERGSAEPVVRAGTEQDEAEIAAILARAFETDPMFAWIFSTDPEGVRAGCAAWMRLVLERTRGRAELDLLTDGSAAAVWIHPDRPLVPDDYAAVAGLLAERIGSRSSDVMQALAQGGRYAREEPALTLLYIGVVPDRQDGGRGSRIAAPGLARAEAQRLPVTLRSTSPRNVPFYERLGFAGLGEVEVAPGVTIRQMWRARS